MLTQDYTYYLFKVLEAGLLGIPGFIAILLLFAALILFLRQRATPTKLGYLSLWACLLLLMVVTSFAFYEGVYEYNEDAESLIEETFPEGSTDCGTAWTNWAKGGYGMGNPCPNNCYRGLTIRKQLSMSGFPPWPEYRREIACWSYTE
jgi:hypothetical protein